MKKFYAILLALALMLSMVACGGEEEVVVDEAVVEDEAMEEEVVEDEAMEEEATEEEMPEVDISAYADLAPLMATCYVGYNESNEEEFAGISFSEDGTSGMLVVSTATESASFVGAVTVEGDAITITDETAGLAITMILTDNGDGTYSLDMGEMGTLVVAEATADDMMYIVAVVDSYTNAVA